ncbi:tripartite tricarboxylate transporter substrate binding protein [Variovorax dokdonensis]|uniref:Tripartite tricarboxylate transporter substrate binding protein n=1 Tax=Variovorax dokdonensis TaxID=344883 RepID=A0ABT7NGN2_9BURK|nr:tripartite tricarboxylate transporter substrate binding protein [Variovorax dokdonensis]MDM0047115.1 tripartite tricarboxylate transporter substrate binding protein [Variovorax dokdonensis]
MAHSRRFYSTALALTLTLAGGLFSTNAVQAQEWPARPIKLIVPYAAGGPTDAIARLLATKVGAALGQPVVVDNRAGAGGTIGVDATAKAPADGYTLALVAPGPLAGMPNLMKAPYALGDLQYLTLVAKIPSVVVVNKKSGIDSLEALVKKAKAEPGKLSYSSAGPGTTPHIGMEIFDDQAGVSMLHVTYKGAAPAITGLLGGEVDVAMVDMLPVLAHINSGSLKALAVAATARVPQLPDVPTTAEKGLPGVLMETTYGIVAPKGIPAPIATKVREAFVAAVEAPETKQQFLQQGALPVTSTGAAYQQLMQAESDKWKSIIVKAKITMQ